MANKRFITDDEGILYYDQGNTHHGHMIPVTLEDRVQIAEADIKNLEERVASLEKKLDEQ